MDNREARTLLKKWARILQLEDYDIRISFGKIEGDDLAETEVVLSEKAAEVCLSKSRHSEIDELIIVHELVHVKTYDVWAFFQLVMKHGFKGERTSHAVMQKEYERLEEVSVEALATVLMGMELSKRRASLRYSRQQPKPR